MPIDPQLKQALDQVLNCLPAVIDDIEHRQDYAKNPEFAADVNTLNSFKQQLLIAEAAPDQQPPPWPDLQSSAQNNILPLIANLISANLVTANMGQLNTDRTIEPKDALANNVNLAALQDAMQVLVARLVQASGTPNQDQVLLGRFEGWLQSLDK